MGNLQDKEKTNLSPQLFKDIMSVFRKIDVDDSKTIDKQETLKYWKGSFAKVNTNALFAAVDADNSGTISEEEWKAFWEEVKRAGYTDEYIREEIANLLDGSAWVQFDTKGKNKQKD